MKIIWIIDHYSSEPKYEGIARHYDFAIELGKKGYRVIVIASGFSHFTHSYISEKKILVSKVRKDVYYVYLKTSSYSKNNSMDRAKNMLDFMHLVIKYESIIAEKYGRPDVVLGCSVHPLTWIASSRIAKKYRVRFVAEVRDFWPRIWVVSGDKRTTDPMVIIFSLVQQWAFKRADSIVYSMYHGDKYICGELGVPKNKTVLIGQPMDCARFDKNREKLELLPELIRDFIAEGFICTFAGYYMIYEGVYIMLEALQILEEKGIPVKMIFVGSGQEKEGMIDYIKKNHLHNVLVYDRIPREAVPALISHSDVCMAHLEVKGHREVYQYGVSKNKVNEYLYSGACTLYGFHDKEDEVALSGGGIIFTPYDAKDLAEQIEKLYAMPEKERMKYGECGRKYIQNNRRVEVLAEKMAKVLFGESEEVKC